MNIEIKKIIEDAIIEVSGRLDTITAPELEKAIEEDLEGINNLVLDIKGLEYVSSAGLRVLLAAHKKMSKTGTMKVINVCDEVKEIFNITGFTDILVIE